MDRRQQKTRSAIYEAFLELLEEKSYAKITVQEIIDRANVGRSTFYAHFETKDSLLDDLCSGICRHVFSDRLHTEKTHDFTDREYDFAGQVTHILYHLQDHRTEIRRLLSGESGELFLNSLKACLPALFVPLIRTAGSDIPESYLQNFLTGSFADTVKWWADRGMEDSPETVAGYYVSVVRSGIPEKPEQQDIN